jgi:hypothetical protein
MLWRNSRQPVVLLPSADPGILRAESEQWKAKYQAATGTPEAPNSLRRRTMRLADDLYDYLQKRDADHPPRIYPDSSVPNPSEERKKQMQVAVDYDQKTQEYYFAHYRNAMVGIIREYIVKGVRTGSLEGDFTNRVPYVGAPGSMLEMNGLDDLSRFRELAWHVDSHDSLIVF